LDQVFESVARENQEIEGQRALAPNLIRELVALTGDQRKLVITNSLKYQSWPVAEELLRACQTGWSEDAHSSEEWAALSLEVIDLLPCPTSIRAQLSNDLRAEAWSFIGNCRRIQSDLRSAERAFVEGERWLDHGTGDVFERARFEDLRSSLLGARGDFDAAISLLSGVIETYRTSEDMQHESRALVKQAKFLRDSGNVERGIAVTLEATKLIDPEIDPELTFIWKKNLVTYYLDADRVEEAQALLPDVRKLSKEYGNRMTRLRLLWIEGKLRNKLGQRELAEQALLQVRDGFINAEIGYDVALVSLDIAALYLEDLRTNDVKRMAVETMPLFASRDIHRELLVAWNLFHRAAELETVTLQLVEDVAQRIRGSETRNTSVVESM
jgi:tetratricopeptide (TPR) repeat protein